MPYLSPCSFINGENHDIWGRECEFSELLPELKAILPDRGGGKFLVRSQFRGLQSSVLKPHFALHPFEISLQVKGIIMLNGVWTLASLCSLFAWRQDLNPLPLFS